MKSTGIVRNMDELGRFVIPKEMRTQMNLNPSVPIEIYVEEDKIILKKLDEACVFCGANSELSDFKGKKICSTCLSEIKD